MSISSLRWRAASVLITGGAAAAAVLALAVPAVASTGTAEISPEQAGYTATGAQFKEIDADVYLRNPAQYASQVASFGHSVQLWSSGLVVTVGVTATTSGSGYTPYATIYDRSTHELIASNPNAQWCDDEDNCGPTIPPGGISSGELLIFNLFYDPKTGDVEFRALPTESNGGFSASYTATGQSFTQARVGTDFGGTPWDGSYSHTPPAHYTKVAAFSSVSLTTYSGHTSTLYSWWVHHKLLANTEQQSGHDWVAVPTDLTNGGANFQTRFVPRNQQTRSQPVLD